MRFAPLPSVLDGWWIEGCVEGKTGWAVGKLEAGDCGNENRSARDAAALYEKLESVVLPLFYGDREKFVDVMRHFMALNGSFFNTHRMVQQYVLKAYLG